MSTLTKNRRTYNNPGDAHELTISCYHKLPLLKGDRTKRWLAEAIDINRKKFNFELWAFVLMPNHVHLIVWPREPEYDIDRIRAAIKTHVTKKALSHLRKHNPSGLERLRVVGSKRVVYRFWQDGPGYDRNLTGKRAIENAIAYIHANPTRRGISITDIDYVWSSARQYAGLGDGPLVADIHPWL